LAYDFTIQITAINKSSDVRCYNVSDVIDGKFEVFGKPGSFFWLVHGTRNSITVEPLKTDVTVKGDGPYKWI